MQVKVTIRKLKDNRFAVRIDPTRRGEGKARHATNLSRAELSEYIVREVDAIASEVQQPSFIPGAPTI